MKRLFIILLFISSISKAQTGYTPMFSNLSINGVSAVNYLAIPQDTFNVTGALQSYPWIASKGDAMYRWSTASHVWIKIEDVNITWGSITGTLSDQLDLQAELDGKQDTITLGTASQYFKGNLSLGTFADDVLAVTDTVYLRLDNTRDSVLAIGDPRYSRLFYLEDPLYWLTDSTTHFKVHNDWSIWDAAYLMGRPIQSGSPANGDTIYWDEAAGQWKYAPAPPSPMAYNNQAGPTYVKSDVQNYLQQQTLEKYRMALEKLYKMILDQQKEIDNLKAQIK